MGVLGELPGGIRLLYGGVATLVPVTDVVGDGAEEDTDG